MGVLFDRVVTEKLILSPDTLLRIWGLDVIVFQNGKCSFRDPALKHVESFRPLINVCLTDSSYVLLVSFRPLFNSLHSVSLRPVFTNNTYLSLLLFLTFLQAFEISSTCSSCSSPLVSEAGWWSGSGFCRLLMASDPFSSHRFDGSCRSC